MKKKPATSPLVSVVLPLHNAAAFVTEAVRSIRAQTFSDWELIIIDDASSDDSLKKAQEAAHTDKRIKILRNSTQLGVSKTTNKAIKLSKGQYIARMDSDDIAMPKRLEKQVAFLNAHPDHVAIGGQCRVIDKKGKQIGFKTFPTDAAAVYRMAGELLPIQQPCMMINRTLLPAHFAWYPEDALSAEEHELLFRLFKYGLIANVPEVILKYRLHGNNLSNKTPKKDYYRIARARLSAVLRHGYKPTLKSIAVNILQYLVVTCLPESIVFPLYTKLRGMRKAL